MTVYDQNHYQTGAVLNKPVRTVVVHDGRRGPRGYPGAEGPEGPQGDSFRLRGQWVASTVYCPLDAVSWRSSALPGVTSLFIQKETTSCALSTVEPHLDLGRWTEIGANKLGDAFGGIWQVQQTAHGFTKIGQPVAYSRTADRYVLADARILADLAIAVVREVVSPDVVILQSTGEVPDIDASVILPDGSIWEPGRVYYVSTSQGRLSLEVPFDPNAYINPILIATNGGDGVVLPWTPAGGPGSAARQLVGMDKYYYTLADVSSEVSGPDDNARDLSYTPGEVDVFVDGRNLFASDFTAETGTEINFPNPLPAGTKIEVWVPSQLTIPVLPSTSAKVDNIEAQFDGLTEDFVLTIGSASVPLQSTVNFRLWLDGTAQEPLLDFSLIEDPENEGYALLHMAQAPEAGTRFWAILMQAAANADQIEMRNDGTYIQWRYATGSDTSWQNLVALADLGFSIDAVGLLAERDDYDNEDEGFVFLATDTGNVYFRVSPTPGVWSDPLPFTGPQGPAGASAYQLALDNGFVGTEAEWIASLQGPAGSDGADGADGTAGAAGDDGLSAYQIAVSNGFIGTEPEWLLSLVGAPGDPGADGADGAPGAASEVEIVSTLPGIVDPDVFYVIPVVP